MIDEADLPLRDLIARTIDDAKSYARAEIAVGKAIALLWVGRLVPAIGLIVPAIMLLQAAVTVLVVALGFVVARWLGPAGGMAVAAVVALLIAALLGWIALRIVKGSGER